MSLNSVISQLEAERKKIWINKPDDIKLMRTRKGARDQNLSIVIYSANDTGVLVEGLGFIRALAKEDYTDLATLVANAKKIMQFYGSRYKRYYSFEVLPNLVNASVEALEEVKTKNDFLRLLEALISYVGKLHYWIDLEIPWAKMTQGY
ncbi:MAG: hypothetical protein ACOYBM_01840 [Dethiobacteria bacterium]|jgi:hypothetical protein